MRTALERYNGALFASIQGSLYLYTGFFSYVYRALFICIQGSFHVSAELFANMYGAVFILIQGSCHMCIPASLFICIQGSFRMNTGLFHLCTSTCTERFPYWYRARVTVNSCVSFHTYTGLFSREDRALSHVCVYMYGVVFILIHGPCHMYIPASLFNPLCRSIGAHLPLQRTTQVGGEIVPIFVVFLRLFFDTACMKL